MSDFEQPTTQQPVTPGGPRPMPPSNGSGWPRQATVLVAVFAVVGLLGAVLGIVGLTRSSGDSGGDVALLTERAEKAEAEVVEYSQLLNTVSTERDGLTADLAAANETLAANETTLQEANDKIAELEALIVDLAEPFPVQIDPNLAADAVEGSYSVSLEQIACEGYEFCGSPPSIPNATIGRVNGQLQLVVSGLFEIPLVEINGQLFGVADQQSLVGPCNGVPRDPSMKVALFADRGDVQFDASVDLTALGASVVITSPAVEGCPDGLVWWAAQLDRR